MRHEIVNPEALGAPRGWNHGILAPAGGRILFVAGQDAAEPGGGVASDDFVEQFRLALEKAVTVVREAGGGPEAIGRLTLFVTDREAYLSRRKDLGVAYRSVMGRHYPAMALVEVCGLVDPGAKVEIEATAVIPEEAGPPGNAASGPEAAPHPHRDPDAPPQPDPDAVRDPDGSSSPERSPNAEPRT